jgi:hypothetical protein
MIVEGIKEMSVLEREENNEGPVDKNRRLVVNASHDPAIPMSFALFEAGRHPEIAARAKREIASVLGDRREITYDDLAKLEYTTAIFKEALRMWPVSGIGIGNPLPVFSLVPFSLPAARKTQDHIRLTTPSSTPPSPPLPTNQYLLRSHD